MSTYKTTAKERCSTCKCTIMERPLKREVRSIRDKTDTTKSSSKLKQDCVATIVGVLSLPDNFCSIKGSACSSPCPNQSPGPSSVGTYCAPARESNSYKDECVEVYRDLGECLQKCILRTSKSKCT